MEIIYADPVADCPKIVSRSRWGAKAPKSTDTIVIPVEYIIIHHTVTPTCLDEDECSRRLVNIQEYHQNVKDFPDIGYNFLIGGDGHVYEGVGWHKLGYHTKNWNKKSVGIGFVGNFTNEAPGKKQLRVAKKLIKCGISLGEVEEEYKLLGARSLRPTSSPGDALFKEIQNWKGFVRSPE
ncbi:PGRPS1 [Trypoxylus dichotomus]